MSDRKRKISIRKVIQTFVTMIVVAGFTMAVISADRLQNRKKLNHITINIRNSNTVHFLDESEVMKMLFADRHLDPQNTTLGRLDIHKMEQIARSNPWVRDAQVYVDNERDVHVFITQRVPVVRIFEETGNSYYLDTTLQAMPVSERYVHYTPIVTGTPQLRDDSNGRATKGKIIWLVDRIGSHKFWNAQIAQVVMTPGQTFELIPVLGKQRIVLGDTDRLDRKLNNLLAFYQQVQNKVGWEKYEVLDLRFNGQVIASPSLPWKAPVDRALTNMNWVKAVMEAGPKNERDESVTNAGDSAAVTPTAQPVARLPVAAVPVKPATAPKPKPPAAKPAIAVQKPPQKPAPKKPVTAAATPKKPVTPVKKKDPKKEDKKDVKKPAKPNTVARPKPKPQSQPRHN